MTPTAATSALSRRDLLLSLAAAPLALHRGAWAQGDLPPLKICQSTALSGPLGDLGQALHQGAKACFAEANAKGGVHGRKIELSVLDDGYDAKRALANLDKFLADRDSFALFNWFGTPIVAATLPRVVESGLPFLAPYTGALLARPKDARNVFNIRASYPDEAEQLVRHLATIGIKRIGIAYQNNAFGKEVYDAARIAMEKHKLSGGAVATVENSGDDATAAAAKIIAGNPEAVLVGLAGKPTVDFVKAMRTLRRGMPLYALSVMGSAATLRDLGDDGVGIAVSQVVPLPTGVTVPIVRQFQQAWKAAGTPLDASHLALEGYINARVFLEALSRAGRNPSRERFIESLWSIKRHDLGGFDVNFSQPGSNASKFVEMTMVARNGRFIR
jgi:ABC-type branched-subunit amino acid transport system substrate-binding protein